MLTEGMYLADRYEIVGKIGTGGMSDVYKAKDHILGRFVAIKILKNEYSEDRNFVAKFRAEAQAAAGLEHPNIVNIYDVGSEEGMYYIVMEHVEGITLKTYVEKKGQLSYKEAISIAIQVARGIEVAHSKNIIHRDIKPQNIIISTEGKVKVTDFGIARAASANTISSDVMGSVHYVSPEQARNGFVDGRSDLYSLGIVMYEMVTGRVPFDGDTTVAVAIQHLQEDMPSPSLYTPDIPVSLEKIILKCAQKNPDRRYQTTEELLADLRKALLNPTEDFVSIAPSVDNGKTKIISGAELQQIKEGVIASRSQETAEENEEELQEEDDAFLEEEHEEEGGFLNPKMDKAVTIMSIVVGVIIVIVIIFIISKIVGSIRPSHRETQPTQPVSESEPVSEPETDTGSKDTFDMISIVGMTVEEAEEELAEWNIKIVVESEEESEEDEGVILEQNPRRGKEVKKGSTVKVVVSNGEKPEELVKVPSVVGRTESEAVSRLENAGLKAEKTYETSDTVPQGEVIRQEPGENSSVAVNSKVTIVISKGVDSVKVPNVIGATRSRAVKALEDEGFQVTVLEDYSDTVSAGLVCKQSPDAGKTFAKGTQITITISLGKKPEPKPVKYHYTLPVDSVDGTVRLTVECQYSDGTSKTETFEEGNLPQSISGHDLNASSGTFKITWFGWNEEVDENGNPVYVQLHSTEQTINFEQQ